jgi:hypothetical protein
VLVNDHGACSVTVAGAVSLSTGRLGALLVAGNADIALLVPETGPYAVHERNRVDCEVEIGERPRSQRQHAGGGGELRGDWEVMRAVMPDS